MRRARSRRLWIGLTAFIILSVGSQAMAAAVGEPLDSFSLFVLVFPIVGALVLTRQSRNALGWVMYLGLGGYLSLISVAEMYSLYALEVDPGSLPLPGAALALIEGSWILVIGPIGTFVLLLFPDGRLPTPRWRPWAWFCGISLTVTYLLFTLGPGTFKEAGYPAIENPFALKALRGAFQPLLSLLVTIPVAIAGCAFALIQRFRRSQGQERLQLKWLTSAGAVVGMGYFVMMLVGLPYAIAARPTPEWLSFIQNLTVLLFLLIPIAIGIAILKYRLYDIDVVINKTIVFGVLAVFITAVYVAIVVGIGSALGRRDDPNLALSIAATAVVAVAFSPVRERTQRLANRLVYGQRATPYEALSRFTAEVATSYETDTVAPVMAQTIATATGAERAEIWLALDKTLVRAASEPTSVEAAATVALEDGHLPSRIPGADVAVPVSHGADLLGALALKKKRGEQVSPVDAKLLADLASQAGIVLRNSQLTAELRARLDQLIRTAEEIRESRRRIVATQDKARRALERDIHDGAQQHLVALAVKLNLTKTIATKKPDRAETMFEQLRSEVDETIETLDELARGIYPPVLQESGIAMAIEARATKASFAIVVNDHTTGRYDSQIEAACYFCVLEAIQNTAKYAHASRVEITVSDEDGDLVVTVVDDGVGFDPATTELGTGVEGMSDRLAAVGGEVEVTSAPGQGTIVRGRIPVRSKEVAS